MENTTMNLFALKGHVVRCCTLTGGYEPDQITAQKYLTIGERYIVETTEVSGWSTVIYLEQFPNVPFNSVFFESITQQTAEQDRLHPDYSKYNK